MKVEENELLESQVTDDQVQDDEDLAFESGFDDSIETPLGETSSESQAEQVQEAQEAQIQDVVEQNPHLTESQVRELFEHNNQRLYGKFGEVQREIKRLEALAQQSFEQREQAQPLNITAEHFSNMREEFGEDFAAALARDLAGLPLGGSGQQGLGQAQIDDLVTQRTESLKNDFEMKIVEVQHPDWQDVAASDDFKGWVSQLPVDVQDQLNSTWDSKFVAKALSAYKNDRDLHLENIKKAELEQQAAEKAKQKKLQAAVLPRSTGKTSDDFDDDFEAGFNS